MNRRRTLITGANRGLGLELTRIAAARGDQVYACCRKPAQATALRALAEENPDIEVVALAVDDPDSVQAVATHLGGTPLDILINNAGIFGPAPEKQSVTDIDFEAWEETFRVNSIAPVRLLFALRPNLALGRPSKAVTITSQMGALSVDMRFGLAYSASKAALNKVMRLLSEEMASHGVAIGLIHPGWVRTDMGGPSADLAPEESAEGVWRVIEGLTLAQAGGFYSWDGTPHPW